jgi:hypothetical membrane protein
VCGLLAPVAFTVGWLLGGLAQPPAFSVLRHDVSDLGALTADRPWLYNQIGANLTGLLVLGLALGLWRVLPNQLWAHVGVAALAVSGAGQFLDGFLRLDCREIDAGCDDRTVSWHGLSHGIETVVTLASVLVAMFALAKAFERTERWADLRTPSFIAGVGAAVTLFGLLPVGSGLAVLVASTIYFAWVALVAYRLLIVARVDAETAYRDEPG